MAGQLIVAAPSSNYHNLFHHTRLASLRGARLLELFSSNDFGSPLEIQLVEISLDDPPSRRQDYEALSYVWGSRFGSEPITCNGQILLITPNCESALRHLRLKSRSRILWVDSISIDQEDTVEASLERSAQVASMGEIYAKASRTLCWLGKGETYTNQVMRHLNQIGVCPSQRGFKKLMGIETRLRADGLLGHNTSCLDHIFCHPWHSRIWTVQEVSFSKDCAIVCGSSSISWENYFKAAEFLIFELFIESLDLQASRNMVSIDMRNVLRNFILDPSTIDDPVNEDFLDEQDQRVTFLTSCLTDVNQLRSTDPKDKIYGLHALYTKLGIPLPAVDYNISIATVYTCAAIAMISWSRSLRVLGDACSVNRNPTLPSWVPDWNDAEARMSVPSTSATQRSMITHTTTESLSPEPGKILVTGEIIVRIVHDDNKTMMRPFPTRSNTVEPGLLPSAAYQSVDDVDFLRLLIDKIQFLRDLVQIIEANPQFFNGEDMIDILHDMLTLGRRSFRGDLFEAFVDLLAYPDSECDLSLGNALAADWMAADNANSVQWSFELLNCSTIVASLLSGFVGSSRDHSTSHADIVELIKEISENLADYKIISAESRLITSRTLGLIFQSGTVGDFMVSLDGADWPVVLRPSGTEWLFVGPAFLPTIMNEASFAEPSEHNTYVRDFTLV